LKRRASGRHVPLPVRTIGFGGQSGIPADPYSTVAVCGPGAVGAKVTFQSAPMPASDTGGDKVKAGLPALKNQPAPAGALAGAGGSTCNTLE